MLATEKGMNNKRITRITSKQCVRYSNLNRGVFVLLLASILLINPFVLGASSTFRITLGTFAPYYSPNLVHIKTGTPISWKNPTADLHTITHDGCQSGERCAFDSGPLGPNGTFKVAHLPPGHYSYHCSFHPIMQGTLVVMEPENTSSET